MGTVASRLRRARARFEDGRARDSRKTRQRRPMTNFKPLRESSRDGFAKGLLDSAFLDEPPRHSLRQDRASSSASARRRPQRWRASTATRAAPELLGAATALGGSGGAALSAERVRRAVKQHCLRCSSGSAPVRSSEQRPRAVSITWRTPPLLSRPRRLSSVRRQPVPPRPIAAKASAAIRPQPPATSTRNQAIRRKRKWRCRARRAHPRSRLARPATPRLSRRCEDPSRRTHRRSTAKSGGSIALEPRLHAVARKARSPSSRPTSESARPRCSTGKRRCCGSTRCSARATGKARARWLSVTSPLTRATRTPAACEPCSNPKAERR